LALPEALGEQLTGLEVMQRGGHRLVDFDNLAPRPSRLLTAEGEILGLSAGRGMANWS
jgi:hypothetical protein